MLRNSSTAYGLLAVFLHWVMALLIFILFPLGIYMTNLSYYDHWYKTSFFWHESTGMLVLALLLFRLLWRWMNIMPDQLDTIPRLQARAAQTAHWLFYILMFVICISGYFITTAEGQAINVWNIFTVAAISSFESGFADKAGTVHWYSALFIILLAVIHTLAALYHHVVLKDKILINILKGDQHDK